MTAVVRNNNKKQYCFYCSKPFCKMARHLAQVQKNEVKIEKALSFPKGSKEIRINLDLLRNKGKPCTQHKCSKSWQMSVGTTSKMWMLRTTCIEMPRAVQTKSSLEAKFGERLCNKMGSNKTKHEYIRTNMREAGRLLVCARKEGKLQSIKDFIIKLPSCYQGC